MVKNMHILTISASCLVRYKVASVICPARIKDEAVAMDGIVKLGKISAIEK